MEGSNVIKGEQEVWERMNPRNKLPVKNHFIQQKFLQHRCNLVLYEHIKECESPTEGNIPLWFSWAVYWFKKKPKSKRMFPRRVTTAKPTWKPGGGRGAPTLCLQTVLLSAVSPPSLFQNGILCGVMANNSSTQCTGKWKKYSPSLCSQPKTLSWQPGSSLLCWL